MVLLVPIDDDPDVVLVQVKMFMEDPLFEDPIGFDFRLQENSPAIDSALLSFAPQEDFYGNSRDGMPDLGAIEYISTSGLHDNDIPEPLIYPNPTTDMVIVTGMPLENIKLYDVFGQEYVNFTFAGQVLNISEMPPGTYLIVWKDTVRRIIKL